MFRANTGPSQGIFPWLATGEYALPYGWLHICLHAIPSDYERFVIRQHVLTANYLPISGFGAVFRYQSFDEREPGYRPREAGGRLGKCPWKMAVCGKKVIQAPGVLSLRPHVLLSGAGIVRHESQS